MDFVVLGHETVLLLLCGLAVLLQVQLQGLHVIVEAQGGHGEENVLAVDCFPSFVMAPVAGLGGDEGDELGDALLDAFSGILGDFSTVRNDLLHEFRHVGDWQEAVLFSQGLVRSGLVRIIRDVEGII